MCVSLDVLANAVVRPAVGRLHPVPTSQDDSNDAFESHPPPPDLNDVGNTSRFIALPHANLSDVLYDDGLLHDNLCDVLSNVLHGSPSLGNIALVLKMTQTLLSNFSSHLNPTKRRVPTTALVRSMYRHGIPQSVSELSAGLHVQLSTHDLENLQSEAAWQTQAQLQTSVKDGDVSTLLTAIQTLLEEFTPNDAIENDSVLAELELVAAALNRGDTSVLPHLGRLIDGRRVVAYNMRQSGLLNALFNFLKGRRADATVDGAADCAADCAADGAVKSVITKDDIKRKADSNPNSNPNPNPNPEPK